MCVECVYLCVFVWYSVWICVNMCHFVSYCVVLCVFLCVLCVFVRISASRIVGCVFPPPKLMYRTASRMSYLLRCQFRGVQSWGGVHVCIWGCVNMGGFCVHMCQLCVFLCVLCVFVRILVWNPVNSCRNVWNTVFCVSFCEFYGMT